MVACRRLLSWDNVALIGRPQETPQALVLGFQRSQTFTDGSESPDKLLRRISRRDMLGTVPVEGGDCNQHGALYSAVVLLYDELCRELRIVFGIRDRHPP